MSDLSMQVIGHLGNDAVIKEINGKKVLNFSIAHSQKFKDSNGVQTEKTIWVSCALWDQPNVGPYLKKGTMVMCIGEPSALAYMPKDSSGPRGDLRMSVTKLKLLSAAPVANNGAASSTTANNGASANSTPAEASDDLPF